MSAWVAASPGGGVTSSRRQASASVSRYAPRTERTRCRLAVSSVLVSVSSSSARSRRRFAASRSTGTGGGALRRASASHRAARTPPMRAYTAIGISTKTRTRSTTVLTSTVSERRPLKARRVTDHQRWDETPVEVFGRDVAERQRRRAQGGALVVGLVRDLGGLVIPDDRRQRGDQHQRPVDVLGDAGLVQRGALDAELAERRAP